MARKVFFSFEYETDNWRVQEVRNMGVLEGDPIIRKNEWETLKNQGHLAIKRWIEEQFHGTSCLLVLIGNQTARSEWVQYEIRRAWELGKGVAGVHIHRLLDKDGNASGMGRNPFDGIWVDTKLGKKDLGKLVHDHYPLGNDSKEVYRYITERLSSWVEGAIKMRETY